MEHEGKPYARTARLNHGMATVDGCGGNVQAENAGLARLLNCRTTQNLSNPNSHAFSILLRLIIAEECVHRVARPFFSFLKVSFYLYLFFSATQGEWLCTSLSIEPWKHCFGGAYRETQKPRLKRQDCKRIG